MIAPSAKTALVSAYRNGLFLLRFDLEEKIELLQSRIPTDRTLGPVNFMKKRVIIVCLGLSFFYIFRLPYLHRRLQPTI